MDWLDLLAVQGTFKSLLQHHSSKGSVFQCSAFFIVQLSHPYMITGKTIALTRRTFVGKVMSLLFNMLSRLQQYMNRELPDVQAGFRKGRGTRDQVANIRWIIEKAREFQKTSISALLTMPKPLTVWISTNCGNSSRDGNTRPPDLPLEKSVFRSGSNS